METKKKMGMYVKCSITLSVREQMEEVIKQIEWNSIQRFTITQGQTTEDELNDLISYKITWNED